MQGLELHELELALRREVRVRKTADERSPGVLRFVPRLDVLLAEREQVERVVLELVIGRRRVGELREHRDGIARSAEVAVGVGEAQSHA